MPEIAVFDHYEVLTKDDGSPFELGRGAMGITYKAFDRHLRMPVALKVINSTYLNSEIARQRFVREARSAAKLRHRNVASVFHLSIEGDTWFYAMEFIDGETVEALVKRQGPLRPRAALAITAQVARALNAAERHGLVHRDIKPANLMLVKEDDEMVAKVIDFGLAKAAVAGEGEDAATVSMGGFVGTFAFASPEQLEEKELDSRSDIYALGVTLWYMLAGQVPFLGTMAQVMSQHLSKTPPFEKFDRLAAPVAGVLRKMLEKDRANRFQTPLELRTAIETCLAQISDEPAEVLAPGGDENIAMLLDAAAQRAGDTQFEIGVVLVRQYRITEVLGETNSGRAFRAYHSESQRDVRVLVLHPEFLADAAACTALDCEVKKLAKVRHPHLLGVHAFETVDQASFVVMEWTDGFSLVDLLRARRELEAGEACVLLRQAAAGVDHALALGLAGLTFDLREVLLHFPQSTTKETLLRTPLMNWPAFELKLYPLAVSRDLGSSQTWAGAQTMVGGAPSESKSTDARLRYLQSLAALVYELLGGAAAPASRGGQVNPLARTYAPLSTLSEEGNEVLKRALDPARSFESAQAFCDALETRKGLPGRHSDVQPSGNARIAPRRNAEPIAPKSPSRPAVRRRPTAVLSAIFGSALLIGVGGLLFAYWRAEKSPRNSDSPATMPGGHQPTVTMTPQRQDSLNTAVRAAQILEDKGDGSKSIEAWLPVAKDFPEAVVARDHLEKLFNGIRTRPNPITMDEFKAMRLTITEAAKLGVPAAMVLLADNLREKEAASAFNWYSAAAAKGDPPALTQLGLMLWTGAGTGSPDPAKAVKCFQDAAEKGDAAGRSALAECYLSGKSVPRKDDQRALELLRGSSQAGDVGAMNRLGDWLVHGIGGKTDFAEAFRLFTQASARGNLEALGNLGVLLMNGDGVAANPKKGAELFEKGARAGNGFCMSLFARCLEAGIGVEKNPGQAQHWYGEGAKAGDKRAGAWCRQHGVPLVPE